MEPSERMKEGKIGYLHGLSCLATGDGLGRRSPSNCSSFPSRRGVWRNQLARQAAVSAPGNIAERQGRKLPADFKLFLRHARGALLEVATQLQIAGRLGYMNQPQVDSLLSRVAQVWAITNGLICA
jgi:four helix bundle protein